MEPKVDEVFEFNGQKLKCLLRKARKCSACIYAEADLEYCNNFKCTPEERFDDLDVYFVNAEL